MLRQKIVLMFKGDAVISMEPLDPDTEKLVDALLGDMVVSKSHVWCG
jgi:hypothetical protein